MDSVCSITSTTDTAVWMLTAWEVSRDSANLRKPTRLLKRGLPGCPVDAMVDEKLEAFMTSSAICGDKDANQGHRKKAILTEDECRNRTQ